MLMYVGNRICVIIEQIKYHAAQVLDDSYENERKSIIRQKQTCLITGKFT